MYWDVVEVKPQPGYRLFVRFKDGLTGVVQLQAEELTGALAPLLDVQFFDQVFIDFGAVAWPGEIDLAPDAMYAQVAGEGHVHLNVQRPEEIIGGASFRDQFPRFYELKDLLTDPRHPDAYFRDFDDRLQDRSCFATFAIWEKDLQSTDPVAWEDLKRKASHYLHKHGKRQRWEQLFDFLGEASAYRYLRECEGCSEVRFIPESNAKTPDLEGLRDHERVLCEVKTINISDKEIEFRREPSVVRNVSDQLESGFLRKLDDDIAKAKSQLESFDPNGDAQHLVYINICFDDHFGLRKDEYVQQIKQHLSQHPPAINVVVSPDTSKAETHVVAQRYGSTGPRG